MNADSRASADSLVSAAEIAKLAGVTRAAVSNWRRRHADFPTPVGGGAHNTLFTLSEVQTWLDLHRRGTDVSGEVLVRQALRGAYGDDMTRGLADVAELLATGSSESLDAEVQALVENLAAQSSPAEVVAGVTERLIDSAGRAGSEQVSTSRLTRAVRHFAGQVSGTVSPADAVSFVRMTDLTANDPDGPFDSTPDQVVDVALIDLLDEMVDLTPARHVAAARTNQLAEYTSTREILAARLQELLDLLPPLTSGPGCLEGATVRVADLARAGLVEVVEGEAVSTGDQLDTDYLHGFLRSTANTRRSTSASGTFRTDVRGSRIPQMSIDDQRLYGIAFRTLDEFERRVRELTELSDRATSLARDGLTGGALRPRTDR